MAQQRRPPTATVAALRDPTHQGFLLQREAGLLGEAYRKRWVVVKDKRLFFFESRVPDCVAKHALPLDGYMIEVVDDQKLTMRLLNLECLAVFKLLHRRNGHEEWLCAPSEDDLQEWIQLLLLEISRESVRMSTVVDFAPLDEGELLFARAPPPSLPPPKPPRPASIATPLTPSSPAAAAYSNPFVDDDDEEPAPPPAPAPAPAPVSKPALPALPGRSSSTSLASPATAPTTNRPTLPPRSASGTNVPTPTRGMKLPDLPRPARPAAEPAAGPAEPAVAELAAPASELPVERKGPRKLDVAAIYNPAAQPAVQPAPRPQLPPRKESAPRLLTDERAADAKAAEARAAEAKAAEARAAAAKAAGTQAVEAKEAEARAAEAQAAQAQAAEARVAQEAKAAEARAQAQRVEEAKRRFSAMAAPTTAPNTTPAAPPNTTQALPSTRSAATSTAVQATAKPSTSRDATGRIVVTTRKDAPSRTQAAGTNAAGTFSSVVGSVQAAVVDWINSHVGSDRQLRDLGHVPVTAASLGSACKDGVLLCFLVNTAVPNTLDVRTVNTTGLADPGRMLENVTLCINSARAIGCAVTTPPADVVAGKAGAAEAVAWQIVRANLRSRLKVSYTGDSDGGDPPSCAACGGQCYDQYSQLKQATGPSHPAYCTVCVNDPVKLLALFSGAAPPSVSRAPASTKPGAAAAPAKSKDAGELASSSAPNSVLELAKMLIDIERRYETLGDADLSGAEGKRLMADMKQFMAQLQPVSQKHAMYCLDLVAKYNELARLIPAKINQANQKARTAAQTSAGGETFVAAGGTACPKCGKVLQGSVVEVTGAVYHMACFGCASCGRALTGSCLNIDGKPYCDRCGKKAFIQSRLAHRSKTQQ